MSTLAPAFAAYGRDDRPPGVRNYVLVLPSVICSHVVAERIADAVDGARAAPHDHGCGQIGADSAQTRRTFVGVASNPNVAGAVVVGLGCEAVQSDEVAAEITDRVPVRELSIQGAGGTEACVEQGSAAAEQLAADARDAGRPAADLGNLTVGIVASDAADSTVERAAPLAGELARAVTDAGGRVVVAGVEHLAPHADAASASAAGEDTADQLRETLASTREVPARTARVRRAAAEYTFDDLAVQWGGLPVRDALDYGEPATHDEGVAVVDAPATFEEAATGLAAAGAQVVVHLTADGVPTGHPLVPVVKVSGDADTVAALPDDIDVDATRASGTDLRDRVAAVADGDPSCAETHGLAEFAITRVGPSM